MRGSDVLGYLRIGAGLPRRDVQQGPPNVALKRGSSLRTGDCRFAEALAERDSGTGASKKSLRRRLAGRKVNRNDESVVVSHNRRIVGGRVGYVGLVL